MQVVNEPISGPVDRASATSTLVQFFWLNQRLRKLVFTASLLDAQQ